jgi:hypothetical protein
MAVFTGNGSVGSPSFTFSSDTNTGIFRPGADQLALVTNGANRVFVNSTGQVGLGTTSPDAVLTVNGVGSFGAGAVGAPSIARSGDLDTGVWFPAANTLAVSTAGAERLRVLSDGRLTYNSGATGSPIVTISEAGSEYMRLSGAGSLIVGATSVPGDECLLNTATYRRLGSGTNIGRGYSERVKDGSYTSGTPVNLFQVVQTASAGASSQHQIYCVLTVVLSTEASGGPGYAGAVSIREIVFSGFGGVGRLRYDNELRNFTNSINAGVNAVSVVTAASVSGGTPTYTLSTTFTPTQTGTTGAIGYYFARIEVYSLNNGSTRIDSF